MFRFAGFELDQQRALLRGPDGEVIKLRPKTFEMLRLFAANAGRTLSKQELMDSVWPNIHVGDDSLFQCIREIRAALGDDQRQLIKLVSGRGYLFEAEVSTEPARSADQTASPLSVQAAAAAEPAKAWWSRFGQRGPVTLAAVGVVGAIVGLAVAAPIFGPDLIFTRTLPTIAVMPIVDTSNDSQVATMAAGVTDSLIDGLTKIGDIRVVAPRLAAVASLERVAVPAAPAAQTDFVLSGELQKDEHAWTLKTRLIKTATSEVQSATSVSIDIKDSDWQLQQSRLAAGAGHPLARRINALLESGTPPAAADGRESTNNANVVIEQANASINKTSRERFAAAQSMLEKALADDPSNVDLAVALAALQLRGIQMVWYAPADSAAAERNAKSMLERALRARPNNISVLEAYCRFLNATNQFVESLVACAKTLAFDPWDGMVLYHMGLAHLQLGRFEDALATFKQADRFDTPQVSRWTWLLGVGWSYVLMGRDEDALPWLERSIAITPASGRPLMLLAAAYQRSGHVDKAKAAMATAMQLRPGSSANNISLPIKNSSPAFLEASRRIRQALIEAGLPER